MLKVAGKENRTDGILHGYMELETEESVVPLEYYFFANFQYISFSDFN